MTKHRVFDDFDVGYVRKGLRTGRGSWPFSFRGIRGAVMGVQGVRKRQEVSSDGPGRWKGS